MIHARLTIGSFNLILCYYLTHIKFAIQHRCYQLNDQDSVRGMRILIVTKERKNVLRVWKWNHGPFFLQAKTTVYYIIYYTPQRGKHIVAALSVLSFPFLSGRYLVQLITLKLLLAFK